MDEPYESVQNWLNDNLMKLYTGNEWIIKREEKVIGKITLGFMAFVLCFL